MNSIALVSSRTSPVDINLHFGRILRKRRRMLGLTQMQLGDLIGLRFQQIQKYECGQNKMSAARLWQLCQALDVAPNYFFDGLDPSHEAARSAQEDAALEAA